MTDALIKPVQTDTRAPVWVLAGLVLLLMAAAKIVYNLPWPDSAPALHQPATFISALLLNAAIVFGPSLIYPVGRFRGAGKGICITASLLTPVAWNIWEIMRVFAFFSPGESLYYGLNSLFLGAVAFAVFQMGVWEAIFRVRSKDLKQKLGLAGPILAALAGLGLVYVFILWALGQPWFYLYGRVYKAIFY